MSVELRQAIPADLNDITNLLHAAFGDEEGVEVAGLVRDLLNDPSAQPVVSLAATIEGRIVGYVLFTRVHIEPASRYIASAILAPLAVHPQWQNQGIGRQLIEAGLQRLKVTGVELVFVLGHPGYYPRYGFVPAGEQGLDAPYPIAPENAAAWMVQELRPGMLGHVRGRVRCADSLNDKKYWQE